MENIRHQFFTVYSLKDLSSYYYWFSQRNSCLSPTV